MRIRAAAITTALLIAPLTACEKEVTSDPPQTPTTTQLPTDIPSAPTGFKRQALIEALRAIDPALVTDEDKAVDNARKQCAAIKDGSKNLDDTAQERFSTDDFQVTGAQAKAINSALKTTLCD